MFTIKRIMSLAAMTTVVIMAGACEDPADTYVDDNIGDASVVDGGLLYDKWWKVTSGTEPTADQALWSTQTSNTRSGSTTWRCKECHGWDYKGADGAYATGSHFTGFAGVYSARTKDAETVFDQIKSGTSHDFGSVMADDYILKLTKFILDGQIDVSAYIDYTTKASKGSATNGATLYANTTSSGGQCVTCHGADGASINFGTTESPSYLGTLANGNPWETLHKIRFGHPGSAMPSTVANGLTADDAADILAYSQSLPVSAADLYVSANYASADLVDGGLMYDKWWVVAGVTAPTADQALWSTQTTNARTGADTWRCKECHGWDYNGVNGAYATGSHSTGFAGVLTAADYTALEVYNLIGAATDHDFSSVLSNAKILDLTKFILEGQIDMTLYVDYTTKASKGNATTGETLYTNTTSSGGQCITCHGADGTTINFGTTADPKYVATLANGNPWEILHKIKYGHPGSLMPSTVANGLTDQDAADILAYSQSLTQ